MVARPVSKPARRFVGATSFPGKNFSAVVASRAHCEMPLAVELDAIARAPATWRCSSGRSYREPVGAAPTVWHRGHTPFGRAALPTAWSHARGAPEDAASHAPAAACRAGRLNATGPGPARPRGWGYKKTNLLGIGLALWVFSILITQVHIGWRAHRFKAARASLNRECRQWRAWMPFISRECRE